MANVMQQMLQNYPVTVDVFRQKGEPVSLFFRAVRRNGGQVCKECGRPFKLSEGEKRFFQSKNLALPKRCPVCRQRRKEEQLHQALNGTGTYKVVRESIRNAVMVKAFQEAGLVRVR